MLADLTGWHIVAIGLVALIVVVASIVGLIVWLVSKSNRARNDDLRRAYEAGRNDRDVGERSPNSRHAAKDQHQ